MSLVMISLTTITVRLFIYAMIRKKIFMVIIVISLSRIYTWEYVLTLVMKDGMVRYSRPSYTISGRDSQKMYDLFSE